MAHLAADPRYASADQRSKHREELLTIIKAILKTRPAAEWLEELLAQRVPCAPINTVDQTLNDPVVLERHMVVQTEHPAYGRARSPGNPMKVEGIRDGQASAAPVQGEHTVAVLRELLGASDQHIDELKKAGVI
jgi:crotonobetainyl-CoA:carnitine CoA-transferase CaiB-like acyl-CoA transferase